MENEYKANNKYKDKNYPRGGAGTQFNLRDPMLGENGRKDWYDEAIAYANKTGDVHGFLVMLKGA